MVENADAFQHVCLRPDVTDTWLCVWGRESATDGVVDFLRTMNDLPIAARGRLPESGAAGGYGHRDHIKAHQAGARAAHLAGDIPVLEVTAPRELMTRPFWPVCLLRLVTTLTSRVRADPHAAAAVPAAPWPRVAGRPAGRLAAIAP
ncbi:MAG: LigA protein [Actinomycetia bacterium]|nr:LigA protein [Actinomycetes bacterium]